MPIQLPTDRILAAAGPGEPPLEPLGRSRQGRPIGGRVLGRGDFHVSLIGGCHADEPVGPEMLERLCRFLDRLPGDHPLLIRATWFVIPHVNPDGRRRNRIWSDVRRPIGADSSAEGFDLALYLRHVVRELPGDDVEFGFPRGPDDHDARSENRAAANFLAAGAPFAVHGTFHGMGLAAGPWFLIEEGWIGRTGELRRNLRRRTRRMGYRPLDVDRGGDKGFRRIDEGFSTRPDSAAMSRFFLARGDRKTAGLFRPSSMEWIRSQGGDPFTFVSENPLFLLPADADAGEVRRQLEDLATDDERRRAARRLGIAAMPIGDQMRLQLAFLNKALAAAHGRPG